MKKIIAALLIFSILLFSFASCQKEPAAYSGTLEELMDAIYEKAPTEIMLNETKQVDLDNIYELEEYLGITSPEGIVQAIYSEPTFTGEAYSLVLLRVDDTEKVESIKAAISDGINMEKWIIASADTLKVESWGDIIMVLMLDSQLEENLQENIVAAFEEAVESK